MKTANLNNTLSRCLLIVIVIVFGSTASYSFGQAAPREWTKLYGTVELDHGYRIKTDCFGRVFVVGRTEGAFPGCASQGGSDAYLITFESNEPRNITAYQWGCGDHDFARGLDVDQYGCCYVVGGVGNMNDENGFLRKFDSAGNCMYQREFRLGYRTLPEDCAVDKCGNIYVYGKAASKEFGTFAFVRIYNRYGSFRKMLRLGHDSSASPWPGEIALDRCGRPVITGYTNGPIAGKSPIGWHDGYIARISRDMQWDFVSLSGLDEDDRLLGIDVTSDGTIVTSGWKRIVSDKGKPKRTSYSEEDYPPEGTPKPSAQASVSHTHHLLVWKESGIPVREIETKLAGGARSLTAISKDEVFIGGATVASRINITTEKIVWRHPLPWTTLGTCLDCDGRLYVTGATNRPMNGEVPVGLQDIYIMQFSDKLLE